MPDRCDHDKKSGGGLWEEANFMTKQTMGEPQSSIENLIPVY